MEATGCFEKCETIYETTPFKVPEAHIFIFTAVRTFSLKLHAYDVFASLTSAVFMLP
jgi:hypothetical protein